MIRRGSVLMLTLLVLAMLTLAAATALSSTGAGLESSAAMHRRASSRALAWSGVQAAMAELAAQRLALIDGTSPTLTREWELFAENGRRAVVRLVAAQAGEPGSDVEPSAAESEAGKLNINTATREMLAAQAWVGPDLADAIIAGRPWSSVESLLTLPGVTSERLYGRAGESKVEDRAASGGEGGTAAQIGVGDDAGAGEDIGASGTPLLQVLTAWSFDPAVQSGLDASRQTLGKQRINLNVPWSDRLGRAVEERFGEVTAKAVEGLLREGRRFAKPSEVVAELRTQGIPPESWSELLDGFATGDDSYVPGRVDVNLAPESVLACIPGINAEAARAIVLARARLDAAQRRGIAWPVVEGVLTPDSFVLAVDWLTTRSTQWRVRVEGGFASTGSASGFRVGGEVEGEVAADEDLRDVCVLEAVIDVSSERPRVAYLRDVTMLVVARAMERALRSEVREAGPGAAEETSIDADAPSAEPVAEESEGMSGELNNSFDAGLDFSRPGAASSAREEQGDAGGQTRDGDGDAAGEMTGGDAEPAEIEWQDRRTGRWRGGGGRSDGGAQRGVDGVEGVEGGASW